MSTCSTSADAAASTMLPLPKPRSGTPIRYADRAGRPDGSAEGGGVTGPAITEESE